MKRREVKKALQEIIERIEEIERRIEAVLVKEGKVVGINK